MSLRLYRVFPWFPEARPGEEGHPLYSRRSRRSRIDNPDLYSVLYVSDHPAGAIAEMFAHLWMWSEEMFAVPKMPGARRALVELEAEVTITDLDEPRVIVARQLRPSVVASSDRAVTQAWARRIYERDGSDGIRWWSVKDARWGTVGIWSLEKVSVASVVPLDGSHPAVREAARVLSRPWEVAA